MGQDHLRAAGHPRLRAASWTRGACGRAPGPIGLQPQRRPSQLTATTQFLKSSSSNFLQVNQLRPGKRLTLESREQQRLFWALLSFSEVTDRAEKAFFSPPKDFLGVNHLKPRSSHNEITAHFPRV